jgi:subtilisin family serine protease
VSPIRVAPYEPSPGLVTRPGAWDLQRGSFRTLIGVVDSDFDYMHPDLYENVWINPLEVPSPGIEIDGARFTTIQDADGDGVVSFADLNDPLNLPHRVAERCPSGEAIGVPDNVELLCFPHVDGGDLVDGDIHSDVGYEGDLNGDGCPGVCGVDDDGDGGRDLQDLQVRFSDYDADGEVMAGSDFVVQSQPGAGGWCALACAANPAIPGCVSDAAGVRCAGPARCCDDDADDILLAAKDDDENGFADDIIGYDFGCDRQDHASAERCAEVRVDRTTWDNAPLTSAPTHYFSAREFVSHGTSVASVIGARGNNDDLAPGRDPPHNITGINWRVRLALAADAPWGMGESFNAVSAYYYLLQVARARHPVRGRDRMVAINASLGRYVSRDEIASGGAEYGADLIRSLDRAGVLFVAAVGNEGVDLDRAEPGERCAYVEDREAGRCAFVPASDPAGNVIAVGAVDRFGRLWEHSNRGKVDVDIAATGANVETGGGILRYDVIALDATNQWGARPFTETFDPLREKRDFGVTPAGGTSIAAPMVTGALGLMHATNPDLSHVALRSLLLATARIPEKDRLDVATGGFLDAHAAVLAAQQEVPEPDPWPDSDRGPEITGDGRVALLLTSRVNSDNPRGLLRLASVDADFGRGASMLPVAEEQRDFVVDSDFAVSEDGTRVVFTSNRGSVISEDFEVFFVRHDPETGEFEEPVQLTDTSHDVRHLLPRLDPTGVYAAFVRDRPDRAQEVVLMNLAFVHLGLWPEHPQLDSPRDVLGVPYTVRVLELARMGDLLAARVRSHAHDDWGDRIVAWRPWRPDGNLHGKGAEVGLHHSIKGGLAVDRDGNRLAYGSGCEYQGSNTHVLAGVGCGAYGVRVVDMSGFQPPTPFDVATHTRLLPADGPVPTDFDEPAFVTYHTPVVGAIANDAAAVSWVQPVLPSPHLAEASSRSRVVIRRLNSSLLESLPGPDDPSSPFLGYRSALSNDGRRLLYVRAATEGQRLPQRVFSYEPFAGAEPRLLWAP